ncbi:thioredoxin-disulfide reductase [candidate division KSB1 bacterium]|nr:thioredoxin-disulfide reductase [candidate division KSB1 bacterium]
MEDENYYKVIIIGSGPAGITAAIYTARADLAPLVFEGSQPGGQLTITTDVDNFPGFPEGILGPKLMEEMKKQAQRFGAQFLFQSVSSVDLSKRPFSVLSDDHTYWAQALIIASGASARMLGLEAEKRLMGHGISACATCDGFFFRDKGVIIVGGGDAALEEAIFLTKFARKVTVIHRRDQLRASKIMQAKVVQNDKINFLWDSVLVDILGKPDQKGVVGVKVRNVKTGKIFKKLIDGVFYAIGHEPNTKLFEGQLELDQKGYIVTHDGTATSIPGVFACGDVQDFRYRQAITAAGSGCMAALDTERFLEAEK